MVKITSSVNKKISIHETTSKVIRKKIEKKKKSPKSISARIIDQLEQQTQENPQNFLDKIHEAFKKINNIKPDPTNRQKEYLLEKVCEKCVDPHFDDLLLLCDICDDGYHTFCLVKINTSYSILTFRIESSYKRHSSRRRRLDLSSLFRAEK